MSEVYQRYFGSKDIHNGKVRMMRDIKEHRLTSADLSVLIDDLESKHMLTDKPFTPKPKECWNEEYLDRLSNGHIADYFSRAYLEHYGEVANYISRQKHKLSSGAIVGGAVLAAVVILLIWSILRKASEASKTDVPQKVQLELRQDAPLQDVQTGLQQEALLQSVQMEFEQQGGISHDTQIEPAKSVILQTEPIPVIPSCDSIIYRV